MFLEKPLFDEGSESVLLETGDYGGIKRKLFLEFISKSQRKNHIVGVKYHNQIALAFHPEVTDDLRVHEYFLSL